ncbi:putative glycolipid-binding domain-containing protein [Solicola sp. PLA-1-18]|uniref:putative glycolipid-binding domain-containing protein n=1 Tax=Solicola sp. PLA-1-18 TaxID=3380532 RepID=UPI003B7AED11
MTYDPLPRSAAWRHLGARDGFEVLHVDHHDRGLTLRGHTSAVEDGVAWSVGYVVEVDPAWRTLRAVVTGSGADGDRSTTLERTGQHWLVDGERRPDLDGYVDVDLESSAVTNTLPVHRLALEAGTPRAAPAVFVRADDLRVESIEQTYRRLDDAGTRFAYESATFGVACDLTYDRHGLVVDYPGLAARHL